MSDDRKELAARLRKHVEDRGGPCLQNGAWAMMLEAATALDRSGGVGVKALVDAPDPAAIRREAREKALREALGSIRAHSDIARKKLSRCYDEGEPESADAWSSIISHLDIAHDSIRDLIDQEPSDG